MRKRLVSIALGVLSVPALGLGAYAAAHAVSDTPAPQVIIPAGFHVDEPIGHDVNDVPGADDPVGHDANDNRLPASTTSTTTATVPVSVPVTTATTEVRHDDAVDNDGPNHDAVDNDGPNHDADENHRGKASTTTSTSVTATTGQDGQGRGGPGPGGGGGGDDGSGHH
jgi:hypothetical protein